VTAAVRERQRYAERDRLDPLDLQRVSHSSAPKTRKIPRRAMKLLAA
jgi:hypothetical protein